MPCWRDEHGIMKPECWHHAGHPKIIASVREAKWRALPQASRDARHIATSNPASVIALCDAVLAQGWRPTHRHRKGGLYRVVARGSIEADLTPAVIYDDAEGRVWVRPAAEFDDGRFAALPTPPAQGGEHG